MGPRTLKINPKDSTVEVIGVDMGGAMTVVAWNRRDGYLMVKVEGGKYWSGLGQPWAYAPARYVTFKALPRDVGGDPYQFEAEVVVETPIRSTPLDLTQVEHQEAF